MTEFQIPEFVSVDPEGDKAFTDKWEPLALEAARLTGWPVEAIDAVRYNGMGPRTNVRVWNVSGAYMDVKLPEHML